MLTSPLETMTCVAKVRSTPTGEVKLVPGEEDSSLYGPVEIEWFPEGLRITALGVGPASVTRTYLTGEAQDLVVEIRLPAAMDELPELVPGAD